MANKEKWYKVVRVLREVYEVKATSKKEAENICMMNGGDCDTSIKSIKITLSENQKEF